jgi:hypothetical protein
MTYEEYLDLVVQIVAKNTKPESRWITAAALGTLLRQASPEANWKTFGKRTLSEFLADPRFAGRLSLTKTEKDALAVVLDEVPPLSISHVIETFNPLRKSIWEAFVLVTPEGRRFMHRRSGIVRVGLEIAPAPADDWAEILPLGIEKQLAWANEFVAEGHGDAVRAAEQTLGADHWHPHTFAQALRQADENLARQWNRFRSSKVSSVVKDWLAQHAIPSEFAFQSSSRVTDVKGPSIEVGESVRTGETETVRRAILMALSSLPLEKLLEIPIPAGVMLSALSTAKMR